MKLDPDQMFRDPEFDPDIAAKLSPEGRAVMDARLARLRKVRDRAAAETAHPDNPAEFRRFTELAREVGAEAVDPETFDRVLEKVARSKPRKAQEQPSPKRKAAKKG